MNAIARQRVNCKGLWVEEKKPKGLTVLTWLPFLLASQYLGFLTWLRSQFLLEKGIWLGPPVEMVACRSHSSLEKWRLSTGGSWVGLAFTLNMKLLDGCKQVGDVL